jgi:hypothetical protein
MQLSWRFSPTSWKYTRSTPGNTYESVFGRKDYLSNVKWLLFIAFRPLVRGVENWPTVIRYYLSRDTSPTVAIRFRNHDILIAPRGYTFHAIAETLLLNAYRFQGSPSVVVDIGASIGDFALLASRDRKTRVYAIEQDSGYCRYLQENMDLNGRHSVRVFQKMADRRTLGSIVDGEEGKIDFLKVDCEGCEYDLLLHCPVEVLNRVRFMALEVHERPPYLKSNLIAHLKTSGFQVSESEGFGRGHHVYAWRSPSGDTQRFRAIPEG